MTAGEIQNWIEGVLDGTYADELHSQKVRADENLSWTYQTMQSAQAMGSEGQNLYNQASYAYEMALKAKKSVQDAINAYSKLVNDIQTYSYGELTPPQLAGLGSLSAVPAIVALAAIGAIAVSVSAFAYAYSRSKSDSQAAVQAISNTAALVDSLKAAGVSSQQIADIVESIPQPSTGGVFYGLTSSLGTWLLLGAAGWLGYSYLKKRGTL